MGSIIGIVTSHSVGANRVLKSHENALVLTLGVGGFDVRRVLVDPSSSTNLLQISTFKQTSYSPSAVKNPGRLLPGFNGARTTSLGDVVLPVQAGPITLNV